jgi:hypothetical protein
MHTVLALPVSLADTIDARCNTVNEKKYTCFDNWQLLTLTVGALGAVLDICVLSFVSAFPFLHRVCRCWLSSTADNVNADNRFRMRGLSTATLHYRPIAPEKLLSDGNSARWHGLACRIELLC